MFGARLKKLREGRDLSQRQLAKILKVSPSSVAMYELNQRSPDKEMISLMSTFFQVPTDYLLGLTDSVPNGTEQKNTVLFSDVKEIPVYSLEPKKKDEIFAQGNIIGQVPISAKIMADIAVEMNDDSMLFGRIINKGDCLIIQKQQDFTARQVVLAQLPDNTYTVRRATQTDDGIILTPDNPQYQPQHFSIGEIRIIGIVVQVITRNI